MALPIATVRGQVTGAVRHPFRSLADLAARVRPETRRWWKAALASTLVVLGAFALGLGVVVWFREGSPPHSLLGSAAIVLLGHCELPRLAGARMARALRISCVVAWGASVALTFFR